MTNTTPWRARRKRSLTHHATSRATSRVRQALAIFGLMPDDAPVRARPDLRASAIDLLAHLAPGTLASITGPSGAGKSTLARELARAAKAQGVRIIDTRAVEHRLTLDNARPIIDAVAPGASVEHAMRLLAAVGLGEGALIARTPTQLSDGQRERLILAIALDLAQRTTSTRTVIIADEFGSRLDDLTLRALCVSLSRRITQAHQPAPSLLAVGVRAQTPDWLGAHVRVHVHASALASLSLHAPPAPTLPIQLRDGTRADYQSLAHLHYRAGPPATFRRVRVAIEPSTGETLGVLVISMPTLNGAWRELAWPGRYSAADRRAAAHRLNDELRCISRVIIDPRARACGVATALIRDYLCNPETPATEALSAMGIACPMFTRAGMTEYILPPCERDARLIDALDGAGVAPRDVSTPTVLARFAARQPWVERELRVWARSSRATIGLAGADLATLASAAARTIARRVRAYAIGRPD